MIKINDNLKIHILEFLLNPSLSLRSRDFCFCTFPNAIYNHCTPQRSYISVVMSHDFQFLFISKTFRILITVSLLNQMLYGLYRSKYFLNPKFNPSKMQVVIIRLLTLDMEPKSNVIKVVSLRKQKPKIL